jgi:hypothetical protein
MESLAIGLVALFASLVGAGSTAAVLWYALRKKLVEPVPIFEKPAKTTNFIIPGQGGIMTLHSKRKCRVNDDMTEWRREQDAAMVNRV